MSHPNSGPSEAPELRRRAQDRLIQMRMVDAKAGADAVARRLFYELQVHQVELELQNVELLAARNQLEAERAHYADFYNSAPVGFVSLTPEAGILRINPQCARFLGQTPQSLISATAATHRFSAFVAPADLPKFNASLRQLFDTGASQTCELTLLATGCPARMVQFETSLCGGGEKCHAVVIDITEARRAADAQVQSEARLALALHGSGDGIWDWNMATNAVVFSRQMHDMLGYCADEFGNTFASWTTRVLPQDLPLALAALQRHCDGHTTHYEHEYRMVCKDASIKWILARGQVFDRDRAGKALRMLGTHTDRTQPKLQEENRHALNLALRDVLVREVHHRIKNNLQGVMGILREFGRTHPQTQEAIAQVVGQVQSVAVIHGLQGAAVCGQVLLCELTIAVAEGVRGLWQTPIEVTIPERWAPCLVAPEEAVPVALVLNELILNAVKHRDPALGPVQVTLQTTDVPATVRLSIVNGGQWRLQENGVPATCGMGLQLVQNLLPREGAQLTRHTGGGCVHTVLVLGAPVLGGLLHKIK